MNSNASTDSLDTKRSEISPSAGIFLESLSFSLMKVAREALVEPTADATFSTPKGYTSSAKPGQSRHVRLKEYGEER